ncbi:MAG: PQQ-dependent sugar dehydrogenase [Pseudomonadota bacterium]
MRLSLKTSVAMFAAVALTTPAITTNAFAFEIDGSAGSKLEATEIASFDQPWSMTFLPDDTMLVATKPGTLFHVQADGTSTEVGGMFEVAFGGQGGLGDVVLHPDFATNNTILLSFAETLDNGSTFGAVVVSATLDTSGAAPALTDIKRLWVQEPKLPGQGHYSHRIAFGPEGSAQDGKLFITSGDRQKQRPAQDWSVNLGKVIRLNADGSVPADNPFQDKGELAKTFWSTGHRNLLGIDFDANGQLWTHEMGPRHGDEINLTLPGENYGWPLVSWGDNYSGVPIPDHDTRPEFNAPEAYWVPAISPSGLVIYDGDMFADWQGDAFAGGLSSQALIRIDLTADGAQEAERFEWGERVREVEQGPDGALYVLLDSGPMLKLMSAGSAS